MSSNDRRRDVVSVVGEMLRDVRGAGYPVPADVAVKLSGRLRTCAAKAVAERDFPGDPWRYSLVFKREFSDLAVTDDEFRAIALHEIAHLCDMWADHGPVWRMWADRLEAFGGVEITRYTPVFLSSKLDAIRAVNKQRKNNKNGGK